jgi:hypothetical protein
MCVADINTRPAPLLAQICLYEVHCEVAKPTSVHVFTHERGALLLTGGNAQKKNQYE